MNIKDFTNPLARQALSAPSFMNAMLDILNNEKLVRLLSVKEIWDAQQIIITGCGDSWLAGIAAVPVFESVAKMDVEVMRCVEFSRFFGSKRLGYSPNTPLVIGISISGAVSRVIEALRRANHYGANTIAITDDPLSPAAREAKHALILNLPKDYEYMPGGNSYIASTLALMQIALRFARAKNTMNPEELENIQRELRDYAAAWRTLDIDERCFALARVYKDLRAYDFIGDYADYATAFFGSAKVLECFGGYTTYDDSEGWCHINFYLSGPETIGRVIIANSDTPSFGRLKETINTIRNMKSPAIVVSDAEKNEFGPPGPNFDVFTTPKAPRFWFSPLLQHIPFDLVAGYIGKLKGKADFRADNPLFKSLGSRRIRESLIKII